MGPRAVVVGTCDVVIVCPRCGGDVRAQIDIRVDLGEPRNDDAVTALVNASPRIEPHTCGPNGSGEPLPVAA